MRPMLDGRILSLLIAVAIAGCATGRVYDPDLADGGSQLVATDEPLERRAGPLLPPQPVDSSAAHPLLAMMARLVANDGAVRPLAWEGVGGMAGTGCGRSAAHAPAAPLAAADPRAALADGWWSRRWMFVGLTLDPGSDRVGLQLHPCRGGPAALTVAYRGGTLAPAVTGRDTSVLFTTRRANVTEAPGSGIVDAVIEQFVAPRAAEGESRRAKPRLRPRG